LDKYGPIWKKADRKDQHKKKPGTQIGANLEESEPIRKKLDWKGQNRKEAEGIRRETGRSR
jgi:hypothetical protein